MKPTVISTSEAERHLGDYLNRVRDSGEHFLLTADDLPVAELGPISNLHRGTWGELRDALAKFASDPSFAEDLERVNQADHVAGSAWD